MFSPFKKILDGTLPVIITSMTPNATSVSNNSNALQNLTNSPSLSNYTKHSRNLSNVSTDESLFKVNFYQGAKSS